MQATENRTSEANLQFRQLQNQLRDLSQNDDRFDLENRDILVVPSLSLDREQLRKVSGFIHYEERLLFSLIRLRNPHTRLIYVTALPISPLIIDYYLQLLPGIPFSHARDRLLLFSTYDASLKPLTQKILERPRLVQRLKKALRPGKAHMVCFNSSPLERELSLALEIPLFAACPDLLYWGSKSGSRELFAEAGIPHPDGSLSLWTVEELVKETAALRSRHPDLQRVAIKLNEGFSGEGNAVLNLRDIPPEASREEMESAVRANLPNLNLQAAGETWESFSRRIPELGAIVEVFIEGEEKRSPSVQGYISPDGRVKILSTHDQILGGPDGQIYLGCRFPADRNYRLYLQEMGLQVGKALAQKGAMERYGVDFIAVREPEKKGAWELHAIEINLRKGGTTHPFMALKLLTNGDYDPATGLLYSQHGQEKYYIASDNLQKSQYGGLLPSDLMDIITTHRLHFDSSTMTGTVFHLIGALSEFGKVGLTSIGNTLEEAQEFYDRVETVLDGETESAIDPAETLASPTLPITWLGRD